MARTNVREAESTNESVLPLAVSGGRLQLGRVLRGSKKSCVFWVTNLTTKPVEVAEITTSCDCLTVGLPERKLAPGQKVQGRACLDLGKEPQFTGKLGIQTQGRGKLGEIVFAMTVDVDVNND